MKHTIALLLTAFSFSLTTLMGCIGFDGHSEGGDSSDASPATSDPTAGTVTCVTHDRFEVYCTAGSVEPKDTYSCAEHVSPDSCHDDPESSNSFGSCSSFMKTTRWVVDGGCADWESQKDGGSDAGGPATDAGHHDSGGGGGWGDSGSPSPTDSGARDGGPACGPQSVSTFTPTWHPPAPAHRGDCTAQQLTDFYNACFGPSATSSTCSAFMNAPADAGPSCARCAMSQVSDSTYSAVVSSSNLSWINVSGCIDVLDPGALSCAQSVQANDQCEFAACGSCGAAYDTCTAAADQGGCKPYATAAACSEALADAGAVSPCIAPDFASAFVKVGMVFCGP